MNLYINKKSIKDILNQPYPLFNDRWKLIISISLFVTLFMLVFQPFGLANFTGPNKTIIISGYGFITFLILIFNLIVLPSYFKKWFISRSWTVIKQITWLVWIIFTIGLGNYLYSSIVFSFFSGYYGILLFQFYTLSIGIIPIVFLTIFHQNLLLSENLSKAKELNSKLKADQSEIVEGKIIALAASSGKNGINLDIKDLVFIESVGNYIKVYYLKDGNMVDTILRNTMGAVEKQLTKYPSIVRCHRAFIVNIIQIDRLNGNSQGLKLHLKFTENEIPVSRSFSKKLRESINSYYQ